MKAIISAAVVAVAVMGCGPDLDEAPAVGTAAQALERPDQVITEPQRLTNEQVFGPNVQADLNRPVFQDQFGYTVHSLGPNH